jgi:hypothetical protein
MFATIFEMLGLGKATLVVVAILLTVIAGLYLWGDSWKSDYNDLNTKYATLHAEFEKSEANNKQLQATNEQNVQMCDRVTQRLQEQVTSQAENFLGQLDRAYEACEIYNKSTEVPAITSLPAPGQTNTPTVQSSSSTESIVLPEIPLVIDGASSAKILRSRNTDVDSWNN